MRFKIYITLILGNKWKLLKKISNHYFKKKIYVLQLYHYLKNIASEKEMESPIPLRSDLYFLIINIRALSTVHLSVDSHYVIN